MEIKIVYIKELLQQVKIVKVNSDKEIAEELYSLPIDINKHDYVNWCLDTYILGLTSISNTIAENTGGNAEEIDKFRDILFKTIIDINPKLDPENIYISPTNYLSLIRSGIKLTETTSWSMPNDDDAFILDVERHYELVDQARNLDHSLEYKEWPLFKINLTIRKFDPSVKNTLITKYLPTSIRDIKYFVVAICLDNFYQIYTYIYDVKNSTITFTELLESLYPICIEFNPFLDITLEQFHQSMSTSGTSQEQNGFNSERIEKTTQVRKVLNDIPKEDILNLEEILKKQIFGQDGTIAAVCNAIQRAYLGIKDPKTPIGAFFFYGSTSTGKTELAKILAKTLTNSKSGLLKISCNTLSASHNIQTLTGSPPGYIGYEDKGLIEKGLQDSKFKVILFDEVEKANSKIYDVVLEMLEEGEIMMANGKVIDVSNSIILFTSNMGQGEANQALNRAGFSSKQPENNEDTKILASQFEKHLKESLKPEFLARLNGIFYFPRLTEENLRQITENLLNKYKLHLKDNNILLYYQKEIVDYILEKCKRKYNQGLHARHIKNLIDLDIIKLLGDYVISKKNYSKKQIKVKLKIINNNLAIN